MWHQSNIVEYCIEWIHRFIDDISVSMLMIYRRQWYLLLAWRLQRSSMGWESTQPCQAAGCNPPREPLVAQMKWSAISGGNGATSARWYQDDLVESFEMYIECIWICLNHFESLISPIQLDPSLRGHHCPNRLPNPKFGNPKQIVPEYNRPVRESSPLG